MGRRITYDGLPPSITWTDEDFITTGATTQTFTSKNIGAESVGRLVIVPVVFATATTSCSMTIGGVSANEVPGCAADLGTTHLRLFTLNVQSGTTATIVVTLGAAGSAFIGVFAADNLSSFTPIDTAADDTSALTLNLDVPALGVACGYAIVLVGAPTSFAWTGMTEAFEDLVGTNSRHSGATYTAASDQSPLSVTATPSAGTGSVGCAASFR